MNVREMLEKCSYGEIVETLASLSASSDPSSVEQLHEFLKVRDGDTFSKFTTPRIVCLALLQKGLPGIKALVAAFPDAPGASYPRSIIEALWYASEGRFSRHYTIEGVKLIPPLNSPLPDTTIKAANIALEELIIRSLEDERVFEVLVDFLNSQTMVTYKDSKEDKRRFRSRVFDAFVKGRILITEELITRFKGLLDQENAEEIYQTFLAEHPVFLDPLASEIIPKHRLGSEFITDFVIRRLDNKYVVVEIEKPQDAVFTAGDDFSAKFTHALGQVLDFQQWIDSHGEYARSLLPEISSPRGVVIIGTAANFSERQRQKLHRFNMNSSTVQVLTFDEVAFNARRLHQNIYRA